MITTETDLIDYLDVHSIQYTRMEHPPVYSCADAALYRPNMPGLETKNLFLWAGAKAGAPVLFYLVMTACEKRLDLKALGQALGTTKLHFASPEQLMETLHLAPGAVTVLALVNDLEHRVSLLVDADYWPSTAYWCHPLVNTATLVLNHDELARFFELTGHVPRVVAMPGLV